MKYLFVSFLSLAFLVSLNAQNQTADINASFTFIDPSTGKQVGPTYEMAINQENGTSIVCDDCKYERNEWGGFDYKGGKWGVVNASGETIIPLEYSSIDNISSRYFSVVKGDLKGIIDYRGEVVAKPIYQELYSWGLPKYWIARNSKGNFGMATGDGKILFDFEYEEINVDGEYVIVTNEKGKRIYNFDGTLVLQSYFDNIELINNEELYFKTEVGAKVQLLDSKGNLIIENNGLSNFYSESYNLIGFQVSIGNKLGLVDFKGKQIIQALYSEIVGYNIDGMDYYLVTMNKKKGLLDKAGKVVIPVKYDFFDVENFGKYVVVSNSGEWKKKSDYDETIEFVPNKYELIDINSKKSMLQLEEYDISTIDYGEMFLLAKKGMNWGVLNTDLNEFLPYEFSSIEVSNYLLFATKGAKVEGKPGDWNYMIEGGVWGAYNKNFELAIPFEYEKIEDDYEYGFGLKVVKSDLIGFVDEKGKSIIAPQFASISKCSNNSCVISNRDSKTGDLKYGIMDKKSGKVLVPAKYSEVKNIRGTDLFIVKNGKLFGVISELGKTVLETKYSYLDAINSDCYLTNEFGEVQGSYVYGGKFGLMSSSGATILKNDYQKIELFYGSDSLVFCESDNGASRKLFNLKSKSFMNLGGFESVVEVNQEANALVVANNLITDEYGGVVSGNFGVVNYSGKILIPGNYTNIFVEKNYFVAVDSLNNKSDLFNSNGTQMLNDYSKLIGLNDSLLIVSEKGTENYVFNINTQKNIFSQVFSTITPVLSYSRAPRFILEKDGKLGVINMQGKEIVPFAYCTITDVDSGDYFIVGTCANFDSGSVPKFGVLNKTGNTMLKLEYDSIRTTQNYPTSFLCFKGTVESERDIHGDLIIK